MPWVRLDDTFDGDPRLVAAGLAVAGLLTQSLAYNNRHLYDGWLPAAVVNRLVSGEADPARVLDAAVAAQVLQPVKRDGIEGFRIHADYVALQPTRAQVERTRAEAKARKSNWRERTRNAKVTNESQRDAGVPNATGPATERDGHSHPDPDPDPDPDADPRKEHARPLRSDRPNKARQATGHPVFGRLKRVGLTVYENFLDEIVGRCHGDKDLAVEFLECVAAKCETSRKPITGDVFDVVRDAFPGWASNRATEHARQNDDAWRADCDRLHGGFNGSACKTCDLHEGRVEQGWVAPQAVGQ